MKYLFANWKNALSIDESVALAKELTSLAIPPDVQLALFPSPAALSQVKEAVGGNRALGAQDVTDDMPQGGRYVLVGHSDRRAAGSLTGRASAGPGDTDDVVAQKMRQAVTAGLIPVLCVGEQVEKELRAALSGLTIAEFFIAYEPLWAIGTGKNAPAETVVKARGTIASVVSQILPKATWHFLYGGSVNAENVASYTHLPGVEGVLVGGAGTALESLRGVVEAL